MGSNYVLPSSSSQVMSCCYFEIMASCCRSSENFDALIMLLVSSVQLAPSALELVLIFGVMMSCYIETRIYSFETTACHCSGVQLLFYHSPLRSPFLLSSSSFQQQMQPPHFFV